MSPSYYFGESYSTYIGSVYPIVMTHPYQCLLYSHRPQSTILEILIASSGSYIYSFNLASGEHLSSWPSSGESVSSTKESNILLSEGSGAGAREDENEGLQPPSKRRKTSPPAPTAAISTESSSAEIVLDGEVSTPDQRSNPVVKLAATSDGDHVVAVTSEDKSMRVYELSARGILNQISERFAYCPDLMWR